MPEHHIFSGFLSGIFSGGNSIALLIFLLFLEKNFKGAKVSEGGEPKSLGEANCFRGAPSPQKKESQFLTS